MTKQHGAFLTIGELAAELDVPQHILRYWETRFPMLRPLQRAGNRRYYRTEDVALAKRIHHLLNVEGYTVRGAQLALSGGPAMSKGTTAATNEIIAPDVEKSAALRAEDIAPTQKQSEDLIGRLASIKALLEAAL